MYSFYWATLYNALSKKKSCFKYTFVVYMHFVLIVYLIRHSTLPRALLSYLLLTVAMQFPFNAV